MLTGLPFSNVLKHGAFRAYNATSIRDAWRYSLDPEFWRHGITISQGLGWSVSEAEAINALNFSRVRLLKAMFGNNFRRKGAEILFLMFKQGSRESFNQHFHALMSVRG